MSQDEPIRRGMASFRLGQAEGGRKEICHGGLREAARRQGGRKCILAPKYMVS